MLQIPEVRTGENIIDAVVVDEEAIGSEERGCGAKILYGKGALDRYISQHNRKDVEVCMCIHLKSWMNPRRLNSGFVIIMFNVFFLLPIL